MTGIADPDAAPSHPAIIDEGLTEGGALSDFDLPAGDAPMSRPTLVFDLPVRAVSDPVSGVRQTVD